MSKREGERKPGELTVEDLEEGLRVNRALLSRAKADADGADVKRRSDALEDRIAVLKCEQAELWARAQAAPGRVAVLEARLKAQEAELLRLRSPKREPAKDPVRKSQRLEELLARLGSGDLSVVDEIRRLAAG